ncbi:MAG: hypothetical protein ABJA67_08115, partial [Chthonomonadales bacterium]
MVVKKIKPNWAKSRVQVAAILLVVLVAVLIFPNTLARYSDNITTWTNRGQIVEEIMSGRLQPTTGG